MYLIKICYMWMGYGIMFFIFIWYILKEIWSYLMYKRIVNIWLCNLFDFCCSFICFKKILLIYLIIFYVLILKMYVILKFICINFNLYFWYRKKSFYNMRFEMYIEVLLYFMFDSFYFFFFIIKGLFYLK